MPSIPVDVFMRILEHADRAELAKMCLLNKICFACSQDVLYREIDQGAMIHVCQTLAQYTHLAKRVRSFEIYYEHPSLAEALRNMSSLRRLCLGIQHLKSPTLLEGCTFKLNSLSVALRLEEPLRNFLNSQPSLTSISFTHHSRRLLTFEETCLPNLTRVTAECACLLQLIPGRPVSEVTLIDKLPIDWSHSIFFTLSTVPIRKLMINYGSIQDKTLASFAWIFPSLTHLTLSIHFILSINNTVRKSFY
jgi:hypothetical protein